MAELRCVINGQQRSFSVDLKMPVLWVIRDYANLTGTKYGCGISQCGACTIHLDGNAVRSCSVTAGACSNRSITTIEGLNTDGARLLQNAWEAHDVPQCGYCQAGQIMTAASYLSRNPVPNEEDIINAMNGNLCRCGTYLRIRKAIMSVVEQNKKVLKHE